MDWFSRFVLAWELSNTLDTSFCSAALDTAFRFGQPEIWNSDQGAQFTSADFLAPLKQRGIAISMDGRGRALDNVFIERLWRSLKYELIDPGDCQSGTVLFAALTDYFDVYNYQPPPQALDYRTPADLFPHPHKRKSLPCWGTLSPHPLGFSLSARLADFSLAKFALCIEWQGLPGG